MERAWMILIFLTVSIHLASGVNPPAVRSDEGISRLFILNAYPGGNENHFTVLQNQVRRGKPGGLFMHNGTPEQIAALVDRMNELSGTPLLIGSTLEASTFRLPPHRIMERITDRELLGETGVHMGEKLRHAGIDFLIDPTLSTFREKYDYGKYLARGYYTEGILPVFELAEGEDQVNEPGAVILPYQAPVIGRKKADYSGVRSMLLRNKGYEGIIFVNLTPQDLETEDAVLHAFKGGADMVIFPGDPTNSVKDLEKWMKTGRLNIQEMEVKLARYNEYRSGSAQPYRDQVRYSKLSEDEYFQERLYAGAVSMVRNENGLIPFRMLDTLQLAGIVEPAFVELEHYLGKYGPFFEFDGSENPSVFKRFDAVLAVATPETDLGHLREVCRYSRVILVVMGDMPLDSLSRFDTVIMVPEDRNSLQRVIPQILYGAVSPGGRWTGKMPSGFSPSLGFDRVNRLTYDQPIAAAMDFRILSHIDEIAREAIDKGATPGLQVLVARQGHVVYDKSFGYQSYDRQRPVTDRTIYDLASVTKVLATLQAVMFMYDKGMLDLDAPLVRYLPELAGSNKADIKVRDVLLHQAGLRPWIPFWQETMDKNSYSEKYYSSFPEESYPLQVSSGLYASSAIRDSVWNWIIDSRLLTRKASDPYEYRYSDMGFYIMQRLVEKELNQGLDEFVSQNFYDPLGMTTTGYLPLCKFNLEDIAPTADDPYFRKTHIEGLVHDEGAAMFGGVAGHSGLFSNANDLAKILQMLLWQGNYAGQQYFKSGTIELFSQKQVKDNRRGLGWDKPNVANWRSPTSTHASASTFGHTGFTGTAVWIDPAYDLVYVFLSNRINPDAENTKLMDLNIRSRIQDQIYKSIWEVDQYNESIRQE